MPRPRKIAIPQLRDDRSPTEYRLKLDPKTHDDLLLYQKLYRQTYGQEIEPRDLLEPIIRRFLDNDRSFRQFRKQQGGQGNESTKHAQPPTVQRKP